MDKKALQQEIIRLETQVSAMQESLDSIKDTLQNLKDIAWDKDSKKESNKMYKVLENEKPSTIVKSNVGDILVDKEFMDKEKQKHLDNPNLRGMITTQELLSFPKVAKNVEADYNPQYQGYTWKAKANDEKTLTYGERKYEIEGKDTHRILTSYSESERGQRKINQAGVGEQGQPHRQINDPNFLRPASESIAQNTTKDKLPTESAIARMKQKIAEIEKNMSKRNLQDKSTKKEQEK